MNGIFVGAISAIRWSWLWNQWTRWVLATIKLRINSSEYQEETRVRESGRQIKRKELRETNYCNDEERAERNGRWKVRQLYCSCLISSTWWSYHVPRIKHEYSFPFEMSQANVFTKEQFLNYTLSLPNHGISPSYSILYLLSLYFFFSCFRVSKKWTINCLSLHKFWCPPKTTF